MQCVKCGAEIPPGYSYCLQCGTPVVQRRRIPNIWIGAAALVVVLFAAVTMGMLWLRSPAPRETAAEPAKTQPAPTSTAGTLQVGRYLSNSTKSKEGEQGTLVITLDGNQVQTLEGGIFILADFEDAPKNWKNGADLNGDGIPDVVVQEYTGGAHCCTTWHVFTLSNPLRQIAEVDAQHSDLFPFADVNNDGRLELLKFDWSFAYWKASFTDSPAIRLYYAWRNGAYEFAPDLMRKPPLSADELRSLAAKVEWEQGADDIPPQFWANILHLIETGNAAQIEQYAPLAWPDSRPGRDAFMKEFWDHLRKSEHWGELQALNNSALPSV